MATCTDRTWITARVILKVIGCSTPTRRILSSTLEPAVPRSSRTAWSFFHPSVERPRSEEHTSELQSRFDLVCRLLLEKKKKEDIRNLIYSRTQIKKSLQLIPLL